MAERFQDVERVTIARPLLDELDRKWSRPVEIMVKGERDEDGDLVLIVRTGADERATQMEEALSELLPAVSNLRGYRVQEQESFLAHVDSVYERVAALARGELATAPTEQHRDSR